MHRQAVYNAQEPTPEYYQALQEDVMPDMSELHRFFNIKHGPAADPVQEGTVDIVSEFFELIITPHLGANDEGTLGFANLRGEYSQYAIEDVFPTQAIFLSHFGVVQGHDSVYTTLVHEIGYGACISTQMFARGVLLDPTPLFAPLEALPCVCSMAFLLGCHFLTVWHCKLRPNIEGTRWA